MLKPIYEVEVVVYIAPNEKPTKHDDAITKAVGQERDASGFFIPTGKRDMQFRFKTQVQAQNACKRVNALKIPNCQCCSYKV